MKKLILLISIIMFSKAGAACKLPSPTTHYMITVPFKSDKQLSNAKFISEIKELLVQQIYTSVTIVQDQNVVSVNGKSKDTFNSRTNSFSSGILINPQIEVCGKRVTISIEKKYVHDLAHSYLTNVIQTDISTLEVLQRENRQSKTRAVKIKLDQLKRRDAYYKSIEPLALLSDNNFDVSLYKEFKQRLNSLDIEVKSFSEIADEVAISITAGDFDQADSGLNNLEILSETKQEQKVYSTLLKRNARKKLNSYKSEKKVLRETKVKQYFLFYEGQINSMFETSPTQETNYGFNALTSHAIGLQFNDDSNNLGLRAYYKHYLNNVALSIGERLPFIFRTNLNELGAGAYFRIKTPTLTLGFAFDVGYVLNKFVGRYDYGLSKSSLTDTSQYTTMNGDNYVTYSPRIILNYSSRNFVPTFYVGATFYNSPQKVNFASVNVGTNIKIRLNKIRKNDLENLKNRYSYNN